MYLQLKDTQKGYVIDIEANSLTPDTIWCVVTKSIITGEVCEFLDEDKFKDWLQDKQESIFIGHNLLSYDIPVLNSLWGCRIDLGRCVDTLVLSYLYNPALQGGHSLEAWGHRLKFPKSNFNDFGKYSEEMLAYCKNDVELTYKLYLALTEKMRRLGYSELSAEIEHKTRVILDEQARHGFYFDRQRAADFRSFLRTRQQDLAGEISKLFPANRTKVAEYSFRRTKDGSPSASYERHVQKYGVSNIEFIENGSKYQCYELVPFNLGSPKQRVERLLSLGWEPQKFTEKGFPQVDEDSLLEFAKVSGKSEVSALAEWLVIQGRASMLDTWFNNLGADSRIHGRVITNGATTRRMIHNNPNTANIPSSHKAKYGKEVRALWGVEPNKGLVLVGVDAAGLETAGLCHYLNNQEATKILLQPKPDDIHTANARRLTEALGRPVDREWGAKTTWYAWIYGAYPKKLGSILKGSPKDGEVVIETFFKNVPGLKELIDDVQNEFRASGGRLRTIDGGFVTCPSLNAALNYKIQSLGAIVMKLACIILHDRAKEIGLDFSLTGFIHDELQMETAEAEADKLGNLAVSCIAEAAERLHFRVPLGGNYSVGRNWSETH